MICFAFKERGLAETTQTVVPVLIVGAGPVGLALAAELGWQGVSCTVVEQTDGAIEHLKVMGIGMRTMEFCRRWGIAEEVRDKGYPKDRPRDEIYVTSLTGYLLARQQYPPIGETTPPPGVAEQYQLCPNTIFDPILKNYVQTLPSVTLRYRVRCEHVTQDGNGATATLADLETGKTEEIRAGYVVSCEGAASSIRKAMGIKLEGIPSMIYATNVLFRSEDLPKLHDKGPGRTYSAVGPEGFWASLYAINGRDLWRLQARGSSDPKAWEDLDAEAAIRRFMGRDFDFEIVAVLNWVARWLLADHYRQGRIFLCGDAARQLSPQGNFGMNTGIADAVDLAWKLRGMIEGWGGPNLLESYEAERRPIGERNVKAANTGFNRMTKIAPGPAIAEDTPAGEQARRETTKAIEKIKHRQTQGVQIGYIYEDSPICVADGTPPPPEDLRLYHPTTRPGARAPHGWLEDGKSVLDLYGQGFVLLRLGPDAPGAEEFILTADACGLPLEVHGFDVPELSALYERKLVLVRPDGHVAWHGDDLPEDCAAVIDRVRGAAAD